MCAWLSRAHAAHKSHKHGCVRAGTHTRSTYNHDEMKLDMASNDQWFMQPPPPHHELTTNSRSLRQSHDAWGVPGLALQRRATTTARIVAVLAHKWCTQVYRNATNPQRHRSRARSLSTLCPPVASGEKRPSPHVGGDWGEKFEWRLGGGGMLMGRGRECRALHASPASRTRRGLAVIKAVPARPHGTPVGR